MKKAMLAYILGLLTVVGSLAVAQFVTKTVPSVSRIEFARYIELGEGKVLSITVDGVTQSKTVPAGKTLKGLLEGNFTLE